MPRKTIIARIKKVKKSKQTNVRGGIVNKTGKLTQYGYTTDISTKYRYIALNKAINKYGKKSVLFMLKIPATMLKNKSPKKSKIMLSDYNYFLNKK
jgi:hypothetical protein